jgi:hypothetical protein
MASLRRHKKPRTPPMAYVAEITLDEAMQSYPKLPLFTVPDNWNPPTDFGTYDKILPSGKPLGSSATRLIEDFTTCYVEEETLPAQKEEMTHSLVHLWRRRPRFLTDRHIKTTKHMQVKEKRGQFPQPLLTAIGRTSILSPLWGT